MHECPTESQVCAVLSIRMGSGNGPSHPSQMICHLSPQAPSYNLDYVPPNQTFHPSMPAPLGRYSTSHCCDGESVLDSRPRALFNEILPVMNQYRDTILWTLVAQGIPKIRPSVYPSSFSLVLVPLFSFSHHGRSAMNYPFMCFPINSNCLTCTPSSPLDNTPCDIDFLSW